MKAQEDCHHRSSDIVVGDEVLVNVLKFDRHAFSTIHKLVQLYAGPFRVIAAVGSNAFKVDLPTKLLDKRIHNVFNVSQLKKYRSETPLLDAIKNNTDSLVDPPQLPLDDHDDLHEPIAAEDPSDMSPRLSHHPTHSYASQRIPPNPREDVKLHPFYFHSACRLLQFKPTVDIFASGAHRQIGRYYTLDPNDRNAAYFKAFSISWTDAVRHP